MPAKRTPEPATGWCLICQRSTRETQAGAGLCLDCRGEYPSVWARQQGRGSSSRPARRGREIAGVLR